MNHVYRVIFNRVLGVWQAVTELAKSQGKIGGSVRRHARKLAAIAALATGSGAGSGVAAQPAPNQLPQGGQVQAGRITIQQSGAQMQIDQATQKGIINWQQFDVGRDASVRFNQPNADAATLNRVNSVTASQIHGQISAVGKVFLLNSSGVVFGPTARVEVGSLVAGAMKITDRDFLDGNYKFTDGKGIVTNQGELTAEEGGLIALLAPQVINEGIIRAKKGTIVLAAGEAITLTNEASGITVVVEKGTLDALVKNKHLVSASDGRVFMSAQAAHSLARAVVSNTGTVEARRAVKGKGGVIRLEGNTVEVAGTLDASSATGKGGQIKVLGDNIQIKGKTKVAKDNNKNTNQTTTTQTTATITASGATGGGEILIGGNYLGKGPERNAKTVEIDKNTLITADATQDGDGGRIIVWSDESTRFEGRITARGGEEGGDGGFVETSSKKQLIVTGTVSTAAPKGKAGQWLLDPEDVQIGSEEASSEETSEDTSSESSAESTETTDSTESTEETSSEDAVAEESVAEESSSEETAAEESSSEESAAEETTTETTAQASDSGESSESGDDDDEDGEEATTSSTGTATDVATASTATESTDAADTSTEADANTETSTDDGKSFISADSVQQALDEGTDVTVLSTGEVTGEESVQQSDSTDSTQGTLTVIANATDTEQALADAQGETAISTDGSTNTTTQGTETTSPELHPSNVTLATGDSEDYTLYLDGEDLFLSQIQNDLAGRDVVIEACSVSCSVDKVGNIYIDMLSGIQSLQVRAPSSVTLNGSIQVSGSLSLSSSLILGSQNISIAAGSLDLAAPIVVADTVKAAGGAQLSIAASDPGASIRVGAEVPTPTVEASPINTTPTVTAEPVSSPVTTEPVVTESTSTTQTTQTPQTTTDNVVVQTATTATTEPPSTQPPSTEPPPKLVIAGKTLEYISSADLAGLTIGGVSQAGNITVAETVSSKGSLTIQTQGQVEVKATAAVVAAAEVTLQGHDVTVAGEVSATGSSQTQPQVQINAQETVTITETAKVQASGSNTSATTTSGRIRITGKDISTQGTISTAGQIAGEVNVSALNTVTIDGAISVDSTQSVGGRITVEAQTINVQGNAKLTATGTTGGGDILVGGDWQGKGTLRQAEQVRVDAGSLINTSAITQGDGGKIVVWSDIQNSNSKTIAQGTLISEGGKEGGDGGKIETSGYDLKVDGITVSTQAQNGTTGQWLLDPRNITITSSGDTVNGNYTAASDDATIDVATLVNALNTTHVTVFTGTTGTQDGNITVDAAISSGSIYDLELKATNDIIINQNITRSDTGGLILRAGSGSVSGTGDLILGGGTTLSLAHGTTLANDIELTTGGATIAFADLEVEYLIVGGGGAGGSSTGGGGGGGGLLQGSGYFLGGPSYSIAVGAGGTANSGTGAGGKGGNSSAFGLTAIGGGGGGSNQAGHTGGSGGSGGGSSHAGSGGSGTSGQGFAGGSSSTSSPNYPSGGGGGAGQAGQRPANSSSNGGKGGDGLQSNITGTAIWYAGGGGGGVYTSGLGGVGGLGGGGKGGDGGSSNETSGTNGLGGGGGGSSRNSSGAGAGGSGVVVVRYVSSTALASGGSVTSFDGDGTIGESGVKYQVHSFTTVGNSTFEIDKFQATITGSISGSDALTLDASKGSITLSGTSTNTGATTIAGGTVKVTSAAGLGNASSVTISNVPTAKLELANAASDPVAAPLAVTIGTIAGGGSAGGNLVLGANTTLVTGNSNDASFGGVISGDGVLEKTGSGTLTLRGNNTYSGGTKLVGGKISVRSNSIGTGILTMDAGTTLLVNHGTILNNDITLSGNANIAFSDLEVEYLIVGGGGGGGGGGNAAGGGGGAGGVLQGYKTITTNSSVVVGGGGSGALPVASTDSTGQPGQNSSAFGLTALGGGGGAGGTNAAGPGSGGSGGGAASTGGTGGAGASGQGFAGASITGSSTLGAGGGGAGGAGSASGAGGIGIETFITGSSMWVGGGGGGGSTGTGGGAGGLGGGGAGTSGNGVAGLANTGGGGGGSHEFGKQGGKGGSGIVVVRYSGSATAAGGSITNGNDDNGTYTIHTYSSGGSFNLADNFKATLSGNITGAGRASIDAGRGQITLAGTSDFTGGTNLDAGTLIAKSSTALGDANATDSRLQMAADTTLLLGNNVSISNDITLMGAVTIGLAALEADVLLVGGGGGGGGSPHGGGGGAGGLIYQSGLSIGGTNSISVGDGGNGYQGRIASPWPAPGTNKGQNGENTIGFGLTALGGGGGGGFSGGGTNDTVGQAGGSGGGGGRDTAGGAGLQSGSASGGFGNAGGPVGSSSGISAGGGGAGQAGLEGFGGDGLDFSAQFGTAFGEDGWFAGGGGGSYFNNGRPADTGGRGGGGDSGRNTTSERPGAGLANTGGGGGGAERDGIGRGGDGGSGVVLVRYLGAADATGGAVSTFTDAAGNQYTIHAFTSTAQTQTFTVSRTAGVVGSISGAGDLTLDAALGTIELSGASSYTGTTTIAAGTVEVASATGLGDGSAVTINSVAGTLLRTVNPDTSASPAMMTLAIGSLAGGSTTGGNVSLGANTTLETGSNGSSTTFAGQISGQGSLTKTGIGNFTLTANNTYAGNTTISGGNMRAGNNTATGSIGTGNVSIADGSTLILDRTTDYELSKAITGAGSIQKLRSASLTLRGDNTYGGGTDLDGGTIIARHSNALGSAGLAMAASTELLLGHNVTLPNSIDLEGAATIGFALHELDVEYLIVGGGGGGGGIIGGGGGAGGLLNDSTLLAGTVTVTVGDGGVGGVGWNYSPQEGSTGQNSSIGNLVAFGGGYGGGHGGSSNTGGAGGSGGGGSSTNAAQGGAGTAGQGNAGGAGRNDGNRPGGGGGAGGAGEAAPSNRAGNGGVGVLISWANVAGYGENGYFAGGGGGGPRSGFGVAGVGGTGGGGNGTTTTAKAQDGQANTGGGGGGAGYNGISSARLGGKGGSGIVLIKYAGSQFATGGTVKSIQFDGDNNGQTEAYTVHAFTSVGSANFAVDQSQMVASITGNITGASGVLTKTGDGELTLTGANTYGGSTTISGGTLEITGTLGHQSAATGSDPAVGNYTAAITNNAQLIINTAATQTLGGAISGTGSLVQAGTGTTILTQNNTYDGTTTIAGGVLQLGTGAGGSSAGMIGDGDVIFAPADGSPANSIPTLRINRSNALSFARDISGRGHLELAGSATITLTGRNTYTGNTSVDDGDLVIASTSLLGGSTGGNYKGAITIASGSSLTNQSTATQQWTGNISSSGTFTHDGTGILALYGSNTFASSIAVNAGTLGAFSDDAFGDVQVDVTNAGLLLGAGVTLANNITLGGTSSIQTGRIVEYLIVGGGGGGGAWVGGGGGAGGVLTGATLVDGVNSIFVAGGGTGAYNPGNTSALTRATNGGSSSAFGLTALGGGHGGSWSGQIASAGASGGGSGNASAPGAGEAGQGFAGGAGRGNSTNGYPTGGGGGAGGAGEDWSATKSGDGGVGVYVDWADAAGLGDAGYFGGGGGGGVHGFGVGTDAAAGQGGLGGGGDGRVATTTRAFNGAANTGGGGGGGGNAGGSVSAGGFGGSGIVAIRYLSGSVAAAGGTVDASGTGLNDGYVIHKFTTVGEATLAMSASSATITGNISLDPSAAATFKTSGELTLSGAISGNNTTSLTVQANTASRHTSSLTTSATKIADNSTVAETLARIDGAVLQGAWISDSIENYASTSVVRRDLAPDGNSATVQMQVLDGSNTKAVIVELTQNGANVDARLIRAAYQNGDIRGDDFTVAFTNSTIANSGSVNGYGVAEVSFSGAVTLSGTNSFAGAVTVDRGLLVANNASALTANNAVTVHHDAGLSVKQNLTIGSLASTSSVGMGGHALLADGTTLTVGNAANTTFSGTMFGAGGLEKVGGGELKLTGVNSFTGGTVVDAGTLELVDSSGNDSGKGVLRGVLTVNSSGKVELSGVNAAFGWNTAGDQRVTTLNINGGLVEALNNQHVWRMTGGVNFDGGGELRVNGGASSDTTANWLEWGGSTINVTNSTAENQAKITGRIRLRPDGAGTSNPSLTINVADNASINSELLISAAITESSGATITKIGDGAVTFSGYNTYAGATTVADGRLIITGGNIATTGFDIASGAVLQYHIASGGWNSYSRRVTYTGQGTIEKTGAGKFWLQNGNGVTMSMGANALIDIKEGTLSLGWPSATDWNSNQANLNIASGATFDQHDDDVVRVGALTGGGTYLHVFPTAGDGRLYLGVNNASGNFEGTISNPGARRLHLEKIGTGTQTLSGDVDHTGDVFVYEGTLAIGTGGDVKRARNVRITNNATLEVDGTFAQANGATFSVGASTSANGYLVINNGGVVSVGNGTGAVYIGGRYDNSGAAGTGVVTINAGGVMNVGAPGTTTGNYNDTGLWFNPWGGRDANSAINIHGTLNTARRIISGDTSRVSTVNIDGGILKAAANNVVLVEGGRKTSVILGDDGGSVDTNGYRAYLPEVVQGVGNFTKLGTGRLDLQAHNTFTGTITVDVGHLAISGNASLNSTSTTSRNYDKSISINGSSIFEIDSSANQTLSGVISGTGELRKWNSGTLTLTNADNSYSGRTFLGAGVLSVSDLDNGGQNSHIGASANTPGNLELRGGTFRYTGSTVTTDRSILLVNSGGAIIDVTQSGTVLTFGGTMGAADSSSMVNSSFAKAGAGSLEIVGNARYSGNTTVNAGRLIFQGTLTGGNTNHSYGSLITVGTGTGIVFSPGAAVTQVVTGEITGGGAVFKTDAGTLELTRQNTYTGGTTVGGLDNLGTTSGTKITGGTLFLNGGAPSLSGVGTIRGTLTVNAEGDLPSTEAAYVRTTVQLGTAYDAVLGWRPGQNVTTLNIKNGALVEKLTGGATGREHLWNMSGGVNFDGGGELKINGGVSSPTTANWWEWGGTSVTVTNPTAQAEISGRIRLRVDNTQPSFNIPAKPSNVADYGSELLISAALTESSGGGAVAKSGAGTLELAGENRYTGNTTITGGTLLISGSGKLGGGSGTNYGGSISIGAGTTLTTASSSTQLWSGVISGSGAFNQDGANLTLSGNSSFSGPTTIAAGGTLQIGDGGNSGALGTSSIDVKASSTLIFYRTGDLNVDNTIASVGTVIVKGTGASGQSSYNFRAANPNLAGNIEVDKGRLIASGGLGTAVIDVLDRGQLLLAVGASGELSNDISIIGKGWLEGAGELGAIRLSSGTLSGNITLKGDARITPFSAGDGGTISGVISETGGNWDLEKTGAGTLTLTNQNTFEGDLLIQNGTVWLSSADGPAVIGNVTLGTGAATQPYLRMGADNQFGAGVVMNFNNTSGNWARFELRGTNQTLAGLNGGSTGTQAGAVIQSRGWGDASDPATDATLTLNGTGTYVYNGYLRNNQDAGSRKLNLVMTGAGTQTLAGSQLSYTGTTTVENGTLVMAGRRANVTGSDYTINSGGTLSFTIGDMWGNHGVVVNPVVNINAGGTLTTNTFSRLGTLNMAGGTLTSSAGGWQGFAWGLSGNVTVTGDATMSGTGTIALGMAQATGTQFDIADTKTLTVSANLVNSAAVNTSDRQASFLRKEGAGLMVLSGSNDYSGVTTINAGEIEAGSTNALSSNSAFVLADKAGVLLDLNDFSNTIASLAGGGGDGGNVSLGEGTLTAGGNNSNTTFAGVISGSTTGTLGGLTKVGSGSMALTGANTYEGVTRIAGGFIDAATLADGETASSIGAATADVANIVLDGGTLRYNGGTIEIDRGFTIAANSWGRIAVDQSSSVVLTMSGGTAATNGRFEKGNVGKLILSGDSLYTGNTSVLGGVLEFQGGLGTANSPFSYSGDILNNTTLIFNYNAQQTIAGVISGTGELHQVGSGTTILTNASNSYTGATRILGGTLKIDGAGRLGTGSYAGEIELGNNATLHLSSTNAQTLSGNISGAGQVIKDETSALTITGYKSWAIDRASGETKSDLVIDGGTVTLQGNASAGVESFGGYGASTGIGAGSIIEINGDTRLNITGSRIDFNGTTFVFDAVNGMDAPT